MQRPVTTVGLRFLTLRGALRSDVPELGDFCRDLYGRFVVDDDGEPSFTLEIRTENDGWRVRDATVDALVRREEWLPGILTARILETVGNEEPDHDLIHGAALVRDGRGLVLCGESGFGKSTLTLGLLLRGWSFLSDEVAALDRTRNLLQPFPKALEVRPEVADLVGFKTNGQPRRRGKILLDPTSARSDCLAAACPATAVVFLDGQEEVVPVVEKDTLRVWVQTRVAGLPETIAEVEGVRDASWGGERDGCPELVIHYRRGRFSGWRLDEVLGRNGALIVDTSASHAAPADFGRQPRIESIPSHEGVARLMRNLRGRWALARRLGKNGEHFGSFFVSLTERLAGASFYRLRVGRLDPALDLLEEVTA